MAGGITTLTDTTDNLQYYWCFQAHFTAHQCRTSSCGSNAYSKTFVTSSYWAGQRDHQWYDADFETCLPYTGSGAYTSTERTCANNRCQALCNAEYGSNCAASTAEISYSRSYMSYCYIYKGECQSSENSLSYGQEGFSERNAAVQSYGSVNRENTATTFFCHEYARRRLSEDPTVPGSTKGRSLAVSPPEGVKNDDVDFKDVLAEHKEFIKHGTRGGKKMHSRKMVVEVPEASNYYGGD